MIRALLVVALLALWPSTSFAAGETPNHAEVTEQNRAIVTDFADIFYTQRDPRTAMMKHVVPGYIQHNPRVGDGRDAAIAMLTKLFGTPGASFVIKRIIVDGNLAVIHVHGRPDPATAGVAAIDIYRLENGKIVEHWDAVQPITPSDVNPHPFF